ncbi:MAG: hypothetical protein ACR2HF_13870 [Methylococcaceae bacterium]
MFQPVKIAFGQFLSGFYADISPTTRALAEFKSRGFAQGFGWCPARTLDSIPEMLGYWQRHDQDKSTSPYQLPVCLVGMDNNYIPTGRDYTRQIAGRQMVMLPDDPKERMFGLRAISADLNFRIAFFAAEEPTSRSLAAQFGLYIDLPARRTFEATYRFAGQDLLWPIQLQSTETPAMPGATENKNMAIMVLDITLMAWIPVFDAPGDDEPNDGQGTTGDPDDPSGYPVVQDIVRV